MSAAARVPRRRRRPLRKVGGALVAMLLGVCLLEAGLQVVALGRRVLVGDRADGALGADFSILCVGDSHTYGWNVDAAAAWPARLEALLRRSHPGARVVNRALPGKNTQTVLGELDEYLERDRPDVLIALVGINNAWSRPHEEDLAPAWVRHLRLWRLAMLVAQRLEPERAVEVDEPEAATARLLADGEGVGDRIRERRLPGGFRLVGMRTREGEAEAFVIGGGTLSEEERGLAHAWVVRDLEEIAARARAAGAEPVFLTYAHDEGDRIAPTNDWIREAAGLAGALLVDAGEAFAPVLDELGRDRLFFYDSHPRREGYEAVARIVHDRLAEADWIEAEPVGDPFAPLRGREPPRAGIELASGDGDAIVLRVSYEPGVSWQLFLTRDPTAEIGLAEGMHLPLAKDDLFEISKDHPELTGEFGDAQAVEVTLPGDAAAALGEGPAWVVLLVRTPNWTPLEIAEPLRLR